MRRFLFPALSVCILATAALLFPVVPANASPSLASDLVSQQAGAPTAAFTISTPGQSGANINASVHAQVTFDATPSQGGALGYTWTFGDGTTGNGQKITHAFGLVDDYTVTLTVGNAAGQTASTTQTLRVVPLVQALV